MDFLIAILIVSLCILSYFGYQFYIFQKKQKISQKIARNKLEYRKARMREMSETHKKTNIFREMAIDSIARQKLIFDEDSERWVRRRQIN
jgi:Tfp pilus assembly protein PilV